VELQWRRLRDMKRGKERRWGVAVFRGEEWEEARQLHDARGGRHSEEWHDGQGSRRQQLAPGGRR
jgi:hypothetical protein